VRHLLEESQPYQFSREEFEEMLRAGWLDRQSAELVDGAVLIRNGTDHRHLRRWTRDEYVQMSEWAWFSDCKVELIGGEVIELPAMYDLHLAGVTLTTDALRLVFGAGYWVRNQGSLDLSPSGVIDPDVAVVQGTPRGAAHTIPTSALLVVEVSESTLAFDRKGKASLYASGAIADYWIVNLVQRQLEVYRNRVADPAARFGYSYSDRTILDPGDFASPLALPQARVAVNDLLP
jgi:putative restriction endonuclease